MRFALSGSKMARRVVPCPPRMDWRLGAPVHPESQRLFRIRIWRRCVSRKPVRPRREFLLSDAGQMTTTSPTRSADVEALVVHIDAVLGKKWAAWPGGWPNEIEAALIDAVLSMRSHYGSSTTGVRGAIGRYRAPRTSSLDDLYRLANADPEQLARVLGRQKTSGRLKTEAIVTAAKRLQAVGVRRAVDLDGSSAVHRNAYVGVRGLGPVTWTYFTMLLGRPGVKADIWIGRFVKAAVGRAVSTSETELLATAAADVFRVSPTVLDHAIWSAARSS